MIQLSEEEKKIFVLVLRKNKEWLSSQEDNYCFGYPGGNCKLCIISILKLSRAQTGKSCKDGAMKLLSSLDSTEQFEILLSI